MTVAHDGIIQWLLAGDVSIQWQVMRDLLSLEPEVWQPLQRRVATEGWGARILSHQNSSGRWTPRLYGKKWISTTYSMVLLYRLGLPFNDERARRSCRLFLDEGLWHDGGINLSATQKRSETCITGLVLALLSWFKIEDPRREQLTEYLANEQMEDGGWNCQRDQGAVHSSFHTTINVLEGLHAYVQAGGHRAQEVLAMEAAAREFFLCHRLYRSDKTGKVVDAAFTRFSFPPRWHHDILRTLDYFRSARAVYDERLDDPVGVVRQRQQANGCWLLQNRHPGATFFELEEVKTPSRWNTLRALRVLKWYEHARENS